MIAQIATKFAGPTWHTFSKAHLAAIAVYINLKVVHNLIQHSNSVALGPISTCDIGWLLLGR